MRSTTDIALDAYRLMSMLADIEDRLAADGIDEASWADDPEYVAVIDTIEGAEGEVGQKLDRLRAVCLHLDAEADTYRAEKKRLDTRIRAAESKAERLRARGLWLLRSLGHEPKVRCLATHSIRTSQAVEGPEDAAAWPAEVQRHTVAPDRKRAAELLRAGVALDGVVLVERQVWVSR